MNPFIGEIIQFGGNFAPRGWAFCDGQLLAIASNTALFSILGTTYGGDGRSTFGLPALRGRVAMHAGNGPGLTPRPLGQKAGRETDTLTIQTMPSHNHPIAGLTMKVGNEAKGSAAVETAEGNFKGDLTGAYRAADSNDTLHPDALTGIVSNTGSAQSHNNLMPYQCINYIIALVGTYPSRS